MQLTKNHKIHLSFNNSFIKTVYLRTRVDDISDSW